MIDTGLSNKTYLKFYPTEGNYGMVGNNTPVFFVPDPMKSQHFIHSQKRRADSVQPGTLVRQVEGGLEMRSRLAFSCKRRHFCPSCHQKRVVEFGE